MEELGRLITAMVTPFDDRGSRITRRLEVWLVRCLIPVVME
ncbi:MAG: hypothetical protein Ct9H300mP27_08640 [Chloroflexota bacterium]|nr:MAG: hypothetical protein Ct9H300mP27_08640 [Chloroflexota bacterium]